MKKNQIVIYLVRQDFRLTDNPALWQALEFALTKKIDFLPIFVLDKTWTQKDIYNIGYSRRLVLSKVLANFATKFKRFLILATEINDLMRQLIKQYELFVFTNDAFEPYQISKQTSLHQIVEAQAGSQHFFLCQNELSIPIDIRTTTGNIYSVFTPFKRAVWEHFLNSPVLPKANVSTAKYFEDSLPVNSEIVGLDQADIFAKIDQPNILKLTPDNSFNLDEINNRPSSLNFIIDEEEVLQSFSHFNHKRLGLYADSRNNLALDITNESTSKMSLPLAWGLVSARTLKDEILQWHLSFDRSPGVESYLSELVWREFYRYILRHFPEVLNLEFQTKMQNIQWASTEIGLKRFKLWIKGQTGYPLVDASMRQIASTGWMHNRSRMVVASVLTKHFGVDWRWGQDYFRAILVDFDEASNNGGWQWAASVGVDRKPIRIFNPYLQATNYDPKGLYQAKWLTADYSSIPIVDHALARQEALGRYRLIN